MFARFCVGLTGGIGSGKSTVASLFAQLGIKVIDTDELAHQLTSPNGSAIPAIKQEFGADYLTPQQALDRPRMRTLIFNDDTARQRLEAIMHPLIQEAAEKEAANAHDSAYLLFVIPLLAESSYWRQRVNQILVVDCSEQQQVERVMQRNGLSRQEVQAIMAAQASREERFAIADQVLVNSADTAALAPHIRRLHVLYSAMAVQ